MRSYLFFIFVAVALQASCQVKISGKVLDKSDLPVEGFVTLNCLGEAAIISFAEIQENGQYVITYNGKADSLCICVSGFMIGNYAKIIANKSQTVNFTVEQKAIDMKEVDIMPDPITVRGDTTDYIVSSYAEQGDRVIGDVLRKIPGIEVSKSGGISYNGKAISKFYIDEMDMLQGRYGLAVNNVNADDVSKVQVMEHHQPIRMLQERTFSEDVAINLKLKDKARGTFALTTALGTGLQQKHGHGMKGLWNEELVGMYFGKNRQTMQTYKGNNSADNILAELTNQYGGGGPITISRVGLLRPGTPNLPQERYLDNQTHALSFNWLERLNREKELTFNVIYTHDQQRREGYTYTELYRPETTSIGIHESQISKDQNHHIELAHKYTNNADQAYTSNDFSVRVSWNDGMAYGQTSNQDYKSAVSQTLYSTPLAVMDHIVLQRLLGENIFRFNINAGYAQSSQMLRVTEQDSLFRQQELMSRTLSLDAFTSYEKNFGHIRGEYGFSASARLYGEDGTLTGMERLSMKECQNLMWYGTYSLSAFQTYSYLYAQGRVALGLPVILDIQNSDDQVRGKKNVFFHPIIQPSLSATYEWDIYHTLSAKAEYGQQVGNLGNLFQGYVMENYRTVVRSQMEKMFLQRSMNVSSNYRYSNALQQVHLNIHVGYSYTWRNQMEALTYDGIYSTSVMQDISNTSSSVSVGMGMSKNFSWLRSYVKVGVGYGHSSYERLVDGLLMRYRQQTGNISLSGALTPIKWMTVSASFGSKLNKTLNEQAESGTIKDYMGRISLKLFPTKQLTLTLSSEGTYDNWANKDNFRYFSDLQVQYTFRRATLEVGGNNLFNQRTYVMNSNSNMDIYHLEYALRPRNILVKLRFKLL